MKNLVKKIGVSLVVGASLVLTAGCKNDSSIMAYTRDTTSGTRDGFFSGISFKEAVSDNSVLVNSVVEVQGNGDMITSVKNDAYGIGYISLSSLEGSGVKGLTFEGVAPTETNVINGDYKLTRNFNYCIRESYTDTDTKDVVSALIGYMSTVEGEATIKEHGGIVSTKATKSWDDVKGDYAIASKDNSGVTINVGGSTSVKSIVSALLNEFSAKCGNFKYNYAPTGSSDAYKRTNGSEKDGANMCHLAFASREFKSDSEAMDKSLVGRMCIDAIVAVVNSENKISSVTKEQLKGIYSGTITSWSELE